MVTVLVCQKKDKYLGKKLTPLLQNFKIVVTRCTKNNKIFHFISRDNLMANIGFECFTKLQSFNLQHSSPYGLFFNALDNMCRFGSYPDQKLKCFKTEF